MREGNFSRLPERNPLTHKAHRREVFWQITFPIIIGALLILTPAVGVWFVGYDSASQAANISTMWLILPTLLFVFIFTLLIGGIAFGLIKLIAILPPYAALVQNFFITVNLRVGHIADLAAEPILKTSSAWASLNALLGRKSSRQK